MELPRELCWLEPLSPNFPHACNSFAVREDDGTWTWIDPGAAGDANLARTRAELDRHGLDLAKLGRVLITHAHVDHIAAAGALGLRVPIHCHPDAAASARDLPSLIATFDLELPVRRLAAEAPKMRAFVDQMVQIIFHMGAPFVATDPQPTLHDGARVTTGPFTWTVLHTPGHAPGHVMFHEAARGLLVGGDTLGHSLAWHSPSSGGAAAYLASVERVRALDLALLLPAHGAPSDRPRELADKLRDKLLDRESKIIDALAAGPIPYAALYDATTNDRARSRVFPFGPMLEGHLDRLARAGAIREDDGVFTRL